MDVSSAAIPAVLLAPRRSPAPPFDAASVAALVPRRPLEGDAVPYCPLEGPSVWAPSDLDPAAYTVHLAPQHIAELEAAVATVLSGGAVRAMGNDLVGVSAPRAPAPPRRAARECQRACQRKHFDLLQGAAPRRRVQGVGSMQAGHAAPTPPMKPCRYPPLHATPHASHATLPTPRRPLPPPSAPSISLTHPSPPPGSCHPCPWTR